ncbi:AT-hook motif nuclear-localized protein [Quillaja saponaria]|uniref:AT-hook motif nuclear-localized protein n=1 Tax=Quillaja saponaria TaxID=32244 RepID=A0AAD7KY17_QUISA|nr:AT-hook motif nuclear-localized protein [Quillaja saponaria]
MKFCKCVFGAHVKDVVSKIKSFASEGPLAVSILTANGVVSSVNIRQPGGSGSLKYEGRFEILNLGGSFTFSGIGGAFRKTGWINVSLAKTDGRVFGGVLEGEMIAAGPIQLVVGSFKQSIGKDLERVCSAASPNPQTPPSVPGMNVMPAMPRVPDNSDLVGVPIKVAKVEINKGYASPTSGLMPAANGGTDNISADNQNMGHAMSEPLQPMPDQRTSEISTGAPQS